MVRVKAGEITAANRWKDKQEEVESWDEVKLLVDMPANMARDVFENIVEQLQKDFRADRRVGPPGSHCGIMFTRFDCSTCETCSMTRGSR